MKTSPTSSFRVPRAILALAVLTALVAFPGAAQKKGKKTFSETTDVVVVEVPITVTDDGEAVRGLTAADFEIVDEGKKQDIVGFEVIDLTSLDSMGTAEEAPREVPIAARRHFLMLFDLAFSQPESLIRARWAARDLIDNLHPTDLAGVAVYTNTKGANLILNFTPDRRQVELAINTLGAPDLVERAPDPLNLILGDIRPFDLAQADVIGQPGADPGGGGTIDKSEFDQIIEEQVTEAVGRIVAAERAAAVKNISVLTGNMEALAQVLASLDGRKHVVYFSEGLPSDVLFGREQTQAEQLAIQSGDAWLEGGPDSDTLFGSTQSQNELEGMIEQFRRAGCVVQSVDIGGLRAEGAIGARAAGEDSLLAMAKDTGGEYFRNFNDLGVAMDKMLERTSVTYLVAFQPKKLRLDGDYHRLKVKLKGGPRGARLSHRAGYYAPLPYEAQAAPQRQLTTAEIIMSERTGGLLGLDVLAAPFPVPGQESYVPVLVEVDGNSILAGGDSGTVGLEVYAYAVDSDGAVHDFFTQSLGLDLAQVADRFRSSGFKYWGHFDLPPGDYAARVMVRDNRGGRHSLAVERFTVPTFDHSEALFWPAMFPEDPARWILVREPETRRRDVGYPFMSGELPYVPSVKPTVPAKGRVPLYFQGFNLAGAVELSAEIHTADGAPAKGATLRFEEPATQGGVTTAKAELETKGLAPGEYTLVANATDASGEPRSSRVRFVVR